MRPSILNINKTSANYLKFIFIICILALGFQSTSYALQPAHEADRLIMAAEDSIENNDYRDAERYLEKAEKLGIALPSDYDFLYGKILQHKGDYKKANDKLELYVNRDGNEGRYYREALSLITNIERKLENKTESVSGSPKSEIKWSDDNDSYARSIQSQQGNKNLHTALTSQINELLKRHPYGDRKILAASRTATPSKHKIKTSTAGEIISINQYGSDKSAPFKEDRFSVYGINPYINYECLQSTASCWIIHPITQKRWLQIEENKETAIELSKALSQLIRFMQKSG
ncbi:MAG: tetratricopeptide repeat protein [Cellvibrionaceae bacterium]